MKGTTLRELIAETKNHASAFIITHFVQTQSAFFRSLLAK